VVRVNGVLTGPGAPAWDWAAWAAELAREGTRSTPNVLLACSGGFDLRWERAALAAARANSQPLLSVRVTATETLIGPLWAGGETGCAGCAQAASLYYSWEPEERFSRDRLQRERLENVGQTAVDLPSANGGAAAFPPWLGTVVGALTASREHGPRAAGELIAVHRDGSVTRHRISRTFRCRVCAEQDRRLLLSTLKAPTVLPGQRRPTREPIPTRGDRPPFALDPERMRAALADPRFGPIIRMTRHSAGVFPVSETGLLVGTPAGMGRAATFREAEAIAVLEAYERMAGYPHAAPILPATSRRELGDLAIDVAALGTYTPPQLASPHSRLRAYSDDAELDWVWAQPLGGGQARLVPAEIGFFRYRYDLRPLTEREREDPATPPGPRRNFFLDSSSGSALGASYEEAALHALLELAERDAFLLAWHRAKPLPRISPASLRDRDSLLMLRLAEQRGYDVHLLAATAPIPVPAVWALAIRRDRGMPASFTTAGCHPDPARAVRAALWELTQMVGGGLAWDPADYEHTVEDPWPIQTVAEHWRRYTFPELLPRVERVLGGPETTLAQAFPDWPHALVREARGDVTGALEYTAELFRQAGLDRILIVDLSTPEHTAHGMSVVKAVVPGIVPMCFGHAQQRLAGLRRLLDSVDAAEEDIPFDPHPFP
jgi:ribosomal protein S12 methylthiotransferase accessory factor